MAVLDEEHKGAAKKKSVEAASTSRPQIRHHTLDEQLKQAYAGAISAFVTRTITQPLDVLKIRFQLQVEPVQTGASKVPYKDFRKSKYQSIMQAVGMILREEGPTAFWKGHNAGQMMSVTYGIMQFWSYEQIQYGLTQLPYLSSHHTLTSFLSGNVAGCAGTFVSMPFDVIRTRLVAQDKNAPGGYKNTMSAIPTILRREGVRGLFRGLFSTMLQIGPLVGANFMFYYSFNDLAKELLQQPDGALPTWCLLMTGGAAGVASKSVVYPLDFIKKRMQLQGFEGQRQTYGANQSCKSMIHCIKLTLRHEGPLGFYKGMSPTLLKSGLTTAIYFRIYDIFKRLLLNEGL